MHTSFGAEAMAACKALELAHDLGFAEILLEGDALSIISRLQTCVEDLSNTGLFIEEARALAGTFRNCTFTH
ncbi:hypothetical protein REPUB_Repub07fG0052500 [Reevesia pubescens]